MGGVLAGPPFEIVSICKGGGYRYCRTNPPHPRANAKGLYFLHRVLAENRLGRLLKPNEIVHHHDGDTENDSEENLDVLDRSEHARLHAIPRAVSPVEIECPVCGKEFSIQPNYYRAQKKRSRAGVVCCSISCGVTMSYRPTSGASLSS